MEFLFCAFVFLVPAQLREFLLRDTGLKLPLREHLRLLLAIASEEVAANLESQQPDSFITRAVARDPDYFLRLFDELGAAGWGVVEVDQPILAEIATRFKQMCRDCGFAFVYEADRLAVTNAEKLPPRFSQLLVTGFDGAQWPLWPLLQAAAKSSRQTDVVLNDPPDEARDIDETWVGTWEENFGEARPVPERQTQERDQREKVHFLVGADTTEQARTIVALTAKFLCETDCERIGILFPQKGPLPRLVASFLRAAQIAHNDAIGQLTPSVFDDDAWRTWLELQQNPQLKFLLQFIRAVDARIFDKTPVLRIEEKLRDAYAAMYSSIISRFSAKSARAPNRTRRSRVQWKRSSFCQRSRRFLNFCGGRNGFSASSTGSNAGTKSTDSAVAGRRASHRASRARNIWTGCAKF